MPRDPQHDDFWSGCCDDECRKPTPPGWVFIYQYDHTYSKWLTIWTLAGTRDEDRTGMSVAISGGLPMRVAVMSPTEVRVYEEGLVHDAVWGQLGQSVPAPGNEHLEQMAMDSAGSRFVVAVPGIGQAEVGSPQGAALVYDLVGDEWALTGTLEGDARSEAIERPSGGTTVVAMSRDGRTVAIGDPFAQREGVMNRGDELAHDVGYVLVFKDTGAGGWQKTFVVEGRWADERCGEALALDGEGLRLAVGYPWPYSYGESGGDRQPEKVRTFELGTAWQELGEPLTSGEGQGPLGGRMIDNFGTAIAFNADGDRLVVGAPFFKAGRDERWNLGKARVYGYDTSSRTGWKQVGPSVVGDNEEGGDFYYDVLGSSVAISAAGDTFAAGMQQVGFKDCERCPGEVRVYEEGEGSDAAASTRVGSALAAVVLLAALL